MGEKSERKVTYTAEPWEEETEKKEKETGKGNVDGNVVFGSRRKTDTVFQR